MKSKKIKLYSSLLASGLVLGGVSAGVVSYSLNQQTTTSTFEQKSFVLENKSLRNAEQQQTPSNEQDRPSPGIANTNEANSKKIFIPIIVGVSIVFVLIIIAAIVIEVYYRRKNSKEIRKIIDL